MAIIQDAITSLMGGGGSEDWLSQLRPGSFRGVPFAVVNEEGSHGRRQAVHEYPYRDTAWIEDMGRGTRRFIIRGFIVQNSLVYGGGDVISQRQSLINACEAKGSGTLIHPTLGEMTVSIPENGLPRRKIAGLCRKSSTRLRWKWPAPHGSLILVFHRGYRRDRMCLLPFSAGTAPVLSSLPLTIKASGIPGLSQAKPWSITSRG